MFSVDGIGGVQGHADQRRARRGRRASAIGYPSLGSCTRDRPRSSRPPAQDVLLSGTAMIRGQFCVSIFDVGNLVEPATYTITVLHS